MSALATTFERWFPPADRRRQIWAIALPIMGGMVSQNILNLVDTAMVGRLGDSALAAAGLGSFANYMAISFIMGLSTAVQALAARRLGEGKTKATAMPLNGGLLLTLIIGIPLTTLLVTLAPSIIQILNTDQDVVSQATPYLQIRLFSIIAVGMNFAFRGYWSAVHMTGLYMRTLIIMHALNIFLNWVLIFGNLGAPAMGVTGAGLATTISMYVGTAIYFFLGWKHARQAGFIQCLPTRSMLFEQFKLSLPASLQQLMFSSGMVVLLWILGKIGTQEVASAHVLITMMLVAFLPAMGIGIAAATLVGNALGRKAPEDAKLWGWNAMFIAAIYGLIVAVLMFIFGKLMLGLFFTNQDTLQLAYPPLLIMAAYLVFDLAGMVLMNALMGAGDTKTPALISIIGQWIVFLPLAWLAGPYFGWGLLGIWALQGVYRVIQAFIFILAWNREHWTSIKI